MSEFTVVLKEDELEAGAMRAVDVDGTRVLVSYSEDGGVCAISQRLHPRGRATPRRRAR